MKNQCIQRARWRLGTGHLITGREGLQNGKGGMWSFTTMKSGGGGAEKDLAMLKGGTISFWVIFMWYLNVLAIYFFFFPLDWFYW